MSPVWTTFLTSLISSYAMPIIIPMLEKKYGTTLPKLDQTQQAALTAGAVGALTASAHWMHNRLSRRHRHH